MNDDDDAEMELVIVNMAVEFYLKQRDDPLLVFMAVGVPRSVFDSHGITAGIWSLIEQATEDIVGEMDSKGAAYVFVTDKRLNRIVIMSDEIQSVSILAPDRETIVSALENNEEEVDE